MLRPLTLKERKPGAPTAPSASWNKKGEDLEVEDWLVHTQEEAERDCEVCRSSQRM